MNCFNHKSKKFLSFFLISILILLSGCGITINKVENSTEPESNTAVYSSNTVESSSDLDPTSVKTTKKDDSALTTVAKTEEKKEKETTVLSQKQTTKQAANKAENASNKIVCTIEIDCKTILKNLDDLRPEKKAFLPESGTVLKETTVTIAEGSTVFDVLKLACKQNTCPAKCNYCRGSGIQLEYVYTPGYDSEYIRGIHQLYEKDCGTQSGWMYSVNGVFPNYGCNKYTVKNGDKIMFRYTCDLGEDLGNNFSG